MPPGVASCGDGAFACWLGWIEDGLVTRPKTRRCSPTTLPSWRNSTRSAQTRIHRARISTGRPTALALTEYLSVSKRTRQVLETVAGVPEAARRLGVGGRHGMEAVERAGIRDQARPFGLEQPGSPRDPDRVGWHLPDRALANLGMRLCLGPGDALIEQPGIQLVLALEPQPTPRDRDRVGIPGWCEQSLPDDTDLILDLALLP